MPEITEGRPTVTQSHGEHGRARTRVFFIESEGADDAEAKLLANKGIVRGVVYESPYGEIPDPYLVAQNLRCRGQPEAPVGGTGLYRVEVPYARSSGRIAGRKRAMPLQGPVWWTESRETVEPTDHDIYGRAIANAANEPIDPPLTRKRIHRTLVGEAVVDGYSQLEVQQRYFDYEGRVNAAVFHGCSVGSLWMKPAQVEDAGVPTPTVWNSPWRVRVYFDYREPETLWGQTYEGWCDPNLHRGRRIVTGQDAQGLPTYEAILDDNGRPVDEPVLLNADATAKLPVGQNPVVAAVYHYYYADFNNLPGFGS